MAEFPALPLWTDVYLADTIHLTTIEHGAYLMLLISLWRRRDDRLPLEDCARVCRLTKKQWERVRPVLERLPGNSTKDGFWTNSRLTRERIAVRQLRQQRSDAGKASALKRFGSNQTSVQTNGQQKTAPTPTPLSKKEEAYASSKEMASEEQTKGKTDDRKRGTRLAADWRPTEADVGCARELGLSDTEIRWQADKFRDHWIGKPGAAGLKLDWPATWRNWCRSYVERRSDRGASPRGGGSGSNSTVAAAVRAIEAETRGRREDLGGNGGSGSVGRAHLDLVSKPSRDIAKPEGSDDSGNREIEGHHGLATVQ